MSRRRQLLHGGRKDALIANVGNIAYKASDGSIKVVNPDKWDASRGAPVGVVVIPSGFAPDNGLARIISLYWGSPSSTSATSAVKTYWSKVSSDTSLPNYDSVPFTNNKGLTNTGTGTSGSLPSDGNLTGTTSYVDPDAMYESTADDSMLIPSPYLGDKPNPAYYAAISGKNNALSDFNGKGNTNILVGLGSSYTAANAARNYKSVGAEEIEWYLPAIGELGYLTVRKKKISEALAILGAANFEYGYYWSSTEYSQLYAYHLDQAWDYVSRRYDKGNIMYVRPFAMLDF